MNGENSKKPITFEEIALALAKDYDSIYVIDSDDSYVEYTAEGEDKTLVQRDAGEKFYEAVPRNCRELVYPEDQENFLAAFKKETVTEVLKNGKSFSLNYRLVINGEPLHYSLKTIKGSDDKVIIGVMNVDEQRRRALETEQRMLTYSHIAGALASRYEVIYYINIKTNEYIQYSASDDFAKLGTTKSGIDFFADVDRDVRGIIYKDDIDYVLYGLEKENLLRKLYRSGMVTLSYRQQLGKDIKFVSLNVVKPKNNPDHIVMGLLNIDAQTKREQSLVEKNELFNNVAMALALRYEVIYRVNVKTNHYYEFSSSDKYTKLEVGNSGDDFFADSQRNMKKDIYEEDYPMMSQAIVKENILSQLDQFNNKLFLNYRLNLDGRPQYVSLVIMRLESDTDHIIVALENVDEAKKREMEFEAKIGSAIDLANRDALTSVKNKHAYVNLEIQLDNQISIKDEDLQFAIVVCDINGLKQVNDAQGHSAGDKYIKDACSIICEIFDHSPVFRIGGDEFAIVLRGADFENRYDLLKKFNGIQNDNRHQDLVTLAYGMAEYMPGSDLKAQDVFERADNLMYANKKRFKEQPINVDIQDAESYSLGKFYELYEQLLSALVDFEKSDVKRIVYLLTKIGLMFRLCKGVTTVYRNPKEEKEGNGEAFIAFDMHKEGREVMRIRAVTSVMTIAVSTVFMEEGQEPLTLEEKSKLELVMRTIISYVSRVRMRDVVYELAYFDDNGYPNLRNLNRELGRIVQSGSFSDKVAVRYNLRHFALVNQEFGREAGDRIIKQHYEGLMRIMGKDGFIGRLGGDNFVCISPKDKLNEITDYLNETVIRVDEYSSVKISSSAGVFVTEEGFVPKDPGEIMGPIISAMRVAQTAGMGRIIFYNENLMKQRQKNAKIQQMLSDAIANEELRPFYQPKVNAKTGEIVGGEALCRWFRNGRIVPPAEFIPALEQTSDICKLDLYMLEHVCRDQRKWLDGGEGRTLVPMSINFSRKNILNMDLPNTIERIMDKYRIPHDAIEIELTETTTDVEFNDLRRVVTELRDKGICASIDDFGIGYSSLNLLRDIPWRTIKIDKSFIPEEGDSKDSTKFKMFCSVLALSKNLGFKCVAEGVETDYQIKQMRELGCDIIQGFYYDPPLPKEEFEAKLASKKYEK